ncbi:class F sortase [Streptomyces sp. NPDC055808]
MTPTAISIPAIGVHHALLSLGQNKDGTLEVPPMSDVSAPGWYRNSPTPGQVGPAVILGHIDGTTGAKGVFYALGALRPGDTVSVTRSDRTVAVFRIDGVNTYPKDAFPTLTVYGNTPNSQLRLITCGGRFDRATQHYLDNTVAYATLTGAHPA